MNNITAKDLYYLGVAEAVGAKAKCIRSKVGAIIVKDDQIISTGYPGAPRGHLDCIELGKCFRIENKIPRGSDYASCRSIHAESNACLHAGRERTIGSTLYLFGYDKPCFHCARLMVNAGIIRCVVQKSAQDKAKVLLQVDWICEPDQVKDWVEKEKNA